MSRARLVLLICGVLLVVSAPTAAAKTDVLRMARRALHIAERADKAARAKPKPIQSKHIAPGGVANAKVVVLGAGVAGAVSALTGADDEIYDLTTLEFADRIRTIQKIFVNHPAQR